MDDWVGRRGRKVLVNYLHYSSFLVYLFWKIDELLYPNEYMNGQKYSKTFEEGLTITRNEWTVFKNNAKTIPIEHIYTDA